MATNDFNFPSADDAAAAAQLPETCVVEPDHQEAQFGNRNSSPRRLRMPTFLASSAPYEQLDDIGSNATLSYVPETYNKHMILAVVALLVAFPFGVIALMLAASARSKTRSKFDEERQAASQEAKISLGLSVTGIVLVFVIVIVAVSVTAATSSANGLDGDLSTPTPPAEFKFPSTTTMTTTTTTTPSSCQFYTYEGHCYQYLLVWKPDTSSNVSNATVPAVSSTNASNADNVSVAVTPSTETLATTEGFAPEPHPPLTWCRFGVVDAANRTMCYYTLRYSSTAARCTSGDLNPEDNFCYHTMPCELAANYRNRICYQFVLPVGLGLSSLCRHGFYADGLCYYDTHSAGTGDGLCNGFRADRGFGTFDDGYCYSSSLTACLFANNYHNGICYAYAVEGSPILCSHGQFVQFDDTKPNGLCLYVKMTQPTTTTACDPSKEDAHGLYCYSNA